MTFICINFLWAIVRSKTIRLISSPHHSSRLSQSWQLLKISRSRPQNESGKSGDRSGGEKKRSGNCRWHFYLMLCFCDPSAKIIVAFRTAANSATFHIKGTPRAYRIVMQRTLELGDIPDEFAAVNKLPAQLMSVAVPLVIGDNDRNHCQHEEEPRPPGCFRHRPPVLASPGVFRRVVRAVEGTTRCTRTVWSIFPWLPWFWNLNAAEECEHPCNLSTSWKKFID